MTASEGWITRVHVNALTAGDSRAASPRASAADRRRRLGPPGPGRAPDGGARSASGGPTRRCGPSVRPRRRTPSNSPGRGAGDAVSRTRACPCASRSTGTPHALAHASSRRQTGSFVVKLQSARTSVSMRTLRSVGLACRPRQARSVCLARLLHVDLLFGASVRAQLAGAIGDTTDRCCGKAAILRGVESGRRHGD